MATVKKTTKKVAEKTPKESKSASHIKQENVFAKITKTIMQLCVAIVAIIVVFSPDTAWVLGPIIGSLSIMGIALGYFASK
ncbi:MAG: hypothetical protein R3B39_02725 [Candidatus Paceibacterota bacterium]